MSEPRFDQPGWQAHDVYNIVYNAAEFAGARRVRSYLRLLAVLATPLSNARGDGPPLGRPLDVWGEWERLSDAAARARPRRRPGRAVGHGAPGPAGRRCAGPGAGCARPRLPGAAYQRAWHAGRAAAGGCAGPRGAAANRAIGATFNIGVALGNYGITLLDRERVAAALPYLRRARALFVQTNADQYIAMTDDLIARAQGPVGDAASNTEDGRRGTEDEGRKTEDGDGGRMMSSARADGNESQ